MNIGEFQLIEKIGSLFPNLDNQDDAAFIPYPDGGYLVLTCDQFSENVHFKREWASPAAIGYRAVLAAVSDVYASGGIPRYILTAISLPSDISEDFVTDIYKGIAEFCQDYDVELVGGNVSKSIAGFSIVTNVVGYAEKPVRRSAARPGDLIAITGRMGNTYLFLDARLCNTIPPESVQKHWERPVIAPMPMPDFIHAACDISDGLAQDLGHILSASKMGCEIALENIPLTDEAAALVTRHPERLTETALSSGEEYALVLAFTPDFLDIVSKGSDIHVIGRITEYSSILTHNGRPIRWPVGFDHLGGNQ